MAECKNKLGRGTKKVYLLLWVPKHSIYFSKAGCSQKRRKNGVELKTCRPPQRPNFFAKSVLFMLYLPQAVQLSIHFLLRKISSVAPPWRTWLRTHYWGIERRKKPSTKWKLNPWPQEFWSTCMCSPALLQPLLNCLVFTNAEMIFWLAHAKQENRKAQFGPFLFQSAL